MYPDLFSIGPFTIHTYGFVVALGFLTGLMVTVRIGKSEGIDQQQVMDMGFVMILSAIIGSRLFYVVMNISFFRCHLIDIFKVWQGGLVFSGGIVTVILVMFRYVKRHGLSLMKICDMWAPGTAIGQAIGRIGCFMAGCCYGRPTDAKWGVVFSDPHSLAPLNIPLHPTQLYSSISGFIIFLILMIIHAKKKFDGQVFLWLLILHSTARLFIERFRGDDRGIFFNTGMSDTQFVTIIILISSVVALIVIKSRMKNQGRRGKNI
ncbi:MAG: prolipoprotein diacylglyceryl transferase [Desulfobacteraceae bacterium 4484_190.1]|nr:MAG: prolipoprotein diacylglyceryl transferase [Desulfobacteraceae bacterium 4484_190.1]